MGTTFVNLQIRSHSVSEIEKVLPGSIVRCFSNGWTTVVSEHFQVGGIEKEAKKLSKTIAPSVMSIEYFDDDLFKMTIYRNGKVVTSHITGGDGYGVPNKLGKPQLIIEQLGFEASEINYLKSILACESLGKKLALLKHFLGVDIWIDHKMLLDDSKTDFRCERDIPSIENYMKATKRNRIKNQTKATLLQEFEGALIEILGDNKFLIGIPPYDYHRDSYKNEMIYTFAPSGAFSPIQMLEKDSTLVEFNQDLATLWEIPNTGYPYYSNNSFYLWRGSPSKQSSELVKINRSGEVVASLHLNYDGYHDPNGKFIFDESGRAYYLCNATAPGRPLVKIFVLSERMELIKEIDLEGWSISSEVLDSKNHKLFVHLSYKELVVINTESFLVVSRRKLEEDSALFAVDANGRIVVLKGMSTIEIIDAQMNDISRHRLKGHVIHKFTNERGNLCLLTGTGGEHQEGGANRMIIRVYELSD